ncbi:MAG: hypothetical protein FWD16_04255 [Clostridia bacterium]|nr:hypothetical protein [Clostridia bacterium]
MTDTQILRERAKRLLEKIQTPDMDARRKAWAAHNSFKGSRPLVLFRSVTLSGQYARDTVRCADPLMRELEMQIATGEYFAGFDHDAVIEPWLVLPAVMKIAPDGLFGLPALMGHKKTEGGAAAFIPSLVEEADFEKMQVADYEVDEQQTARRLEHAQEALGGVMPVMSDRQGPLLRGQGQSDISNILCKLRGMENLMFDFYDRPEWLHRVLAFMRDKILLQCDQTERAKGFNRYNNTNQSVPYAHELPAPAADPVPVCQHQLWGFMAAQEFALVGPEIFKEFMFDYQKPILERYGLVTYGCCEDLTQKIPLLKTVPTIRRIAVTPLADIRANAEQLGPDYIASWRPNPSSAVSFGVDEAFTRKTMREAVKIFRENNCRFDITLKDVETTGGDETAIPRWLKIVNEEIN